MTKMACIAYNAPVQLFALETNIETLKKRFLSEEEKEIRTIHFHWIRFFLKLMTLTFWTLALIAIGVGLGMAGVSVVWVTGIGIAIWVVLIFFPLLRAYLDWLYDFILITTDKVIVVDQSSLFHQKVTPMNLENFASASAETQFWNLFPFGVLHFNLKEGVGSGVNLRFIPHAHDVASLLSDAITTFQRRKDLRRYGGGDDEPGAPQAPAPAAH